MTVKYISVKYLIFMLLGIKNFNSESSLNFTSFIESIILCFMFHKY